MECNANSTVTIIEPMIESIAKRIQSLVEDESRPVVVLVGAPAHSGKTRLSRRLREALMFENIPVTTLSNDLWLMGTNRTPPGVTFGVMENVDATAFKKTVLRLISGEVVRPPIYNLGNRWHVADEGEPLSFSEGVLILDGSVVLSMEELREIASMCIYIDIPDDIRNGWIRQCSLGFKGLSLEETRRGIETGQSGEAPIAKASAKYAGVIYQPDPSRLPLVVECDHK